MTIFAALLPNRFARLPADRRAMIRTGPGWAATGVVDHFRAYTDIYGRRFADEAVLRIRDTLGRAGRGRARVHLRDGGAFVVAMAVGSLREAMDLADDFRAAVEALQIPHQGSPFGLVTVSMGIAALAGEGEEARFEAMERARSALERAQACGPNHVLAAGLALV